MTVSTTTTAAVGPAPVQSVSAVNRGLPYILQSKSQPQPADGRQV